MRLALLWCPLLLLTACATSGTATPKEPAAQVAPVEEAESQSPADPVAVFKRYRDHMREAHRLLETDAEGALVQFRQADETGVELSSGSLFDAAGAAAGAGHHDEALTWLRRAIDKSFEDLERLEEDASLEPIRAHPGYVAQVERLRTLLAAQNAELRGELLAMIQEDEASRIAWSQAKPGEEERKLAAQTVEIDAKNTARLKEIIAEHGWPKLSQVGLDAARGAFLLVMHAGTEVAFRKEVLREMEKAVEEDEAFHPDLAYLTDRILMLEGKPQRYGTQYDLVEGEIRPRPLEDPEHVDLRRVQRQLGLLEDYLRRVAESAGLPYSMEPASLLKVKDG